MGEHCVGVLYSGNNVSEKKKVSGSEKKSLKRGGGGW